MLTLYGKIDFADVIKLSISRKAVILEYLDEPNVITGVLTGGREKSRSQRIRHDDGSRGWSHAISGRERKPRNVGGL